MNLKTFLSGFFIGGLAAGVSTLLTTPNSGKDTRLKIKETNDRFRNELILLRNNLNQIKTSTVGASKEGKKQISIFIKELKSSLKTWEEEIRPAQENLKKELDELRESIEDIEKIFNEDSKNH